MKFLDKIKNQLMERRDAKSKESCPVIPEVDPDYPAPDPERKFYEKWNVIWWLNGVSIII